MKYVSPKYSREAVETNDVIMESIFTVCHTKNEQGENVSQIIVNADKLFGGF